MTLCKVGTTYWRGDRSAPARMRRGVIARLSLALTGFALTVPVTAAEAQLLETMKALSEGGSWLNLPVRSGKAALRGPLVPLGGLAINGCFVVWRRHSGEWTVHAKDERSGQAIDTVAIPGAPVRFAYKAGFTARFSVDVEWSEPRDTTLFIWVGASRARRGSSDDGAEGDGEDICTPRIQHSKSRGGTK